MRPGHGLKKLVLSSNLHFHTISLEGTMVEVRDRRSLSSFFCFAISNSTQLSLSIPHHFKPPSPTTQSDHAATALGEGQQ